MVWALSGGRFTAPWNEKWAILIVGAPPRATGFADVDLRCGCDAVAQASRE
jgi:hypothetical protein